MRSWLGMLTAGSPAITNSARTCSGPGVRISSASTFAGNCPSLCFSPRKRLSSAESFGSSGSSSCVWARQVRPGSSTYGLGTFSPSRSHRPVIVFSASTRYSCSVPRGCMSSPVPEVTRPRWPAANVCAASCMSVAGTFVRSST